MRIRVSGGKLSETKKQELLDAFETRALELHYGSADALAQAYYALPDEQTYNVDNPIADAFYESSEAAIAEVFGADWDNPNISIDFEM